MFNKKRSCASAALVLASFLAVTSANAQLVQKCYTVASLQGNYAVIGNYGANVAIALAVVNFDGSGNLTGSFVVNEPTAGSTSGDRTIVTGTQTGTYTVNCNGIGVITRLLKASNGVTSNQMDDFVITGAVPQAGQLLATAIVDAQRTPSTIVLGGIFLSRTLTRLPDYLIEN